VPLTLVPVLACAHLPFEAVLTVMLLAGAGGVPGAAAACRTSTQLPVLTSVSCAGLTWKTFVDGVMATAVGPFTAVTATVLPDTEFTLPSARTFGGAGGAGGGAGAGDEGADAWAVDRVDDAVGLAGVDVPQAASRRTVADTATSRAGCRIWRKAME
jgi:hypothetical protein